MKTRERDKMVGWVVWSLLLIRRVGEHRSLFPCLCPYLGVGMPGKRFRTVSFSCPFVGRHRFAAPRFRSSAQGGSEHPQRYIATRRCHSRCSQATPLKTALRRQNQTSPSSRSARPGHEQQNPQPGPQLGSSRAAQALTQA